MTAREIYDGSDGAATRALYANLMLIGPMGAIAVNLFRAQKSSGRAKKYRGGIRGVGSYRSMAYDRKGWSLGQLCEILTRDAVAHQIVWGWKPDPEVKLGGATSWVLYIDLPDIGQVSFHAPERGIGPDYSGAWDGTHESAARIIRLCDELLGIDTGRRPEMISGEQMIIK